MAATAPPEHRAARSKDPPARPAPRVQCKLQVGPARDRFEIEAERIADRITSSPARATLPPAITPLAATAAQRAPDPKRAAPRPTGEVTTEKIEDEEEGTAEPDMVQRSADGPVIAPAAAEASIARMRAAGGRPMAPDTQGRMEAGLGRSLSSVRIHDSPAAHRTARDVGARAFTLGPDVFFGAGRYRPGTASGDHLLAHELVHTQQQAGPARAMRLQRQGEGEATEDEEDAGPGLEFVKPGARSHRIVLNEGRPGGRIFLPFIKVPRIQGATKGSAGHPKAPGVNDPDFNPLVTGTPYVYKGKNPRGSDTARQQFLRSEYFRAADQEVEPALLSLLPAKVRNWDSAADVNDTTTGEKRYYLKRRNERTARANSIIIGTLAQLADHQLVKLPNWGRDGTFQRYDVDHAQELQLGGLDGWENFWLLDQTANRSSGARIASELSGDVSEIIRAATDAQFFSGPNAGRAPSFNGIKDGAQPWEVEFARFRNLDISSSETDYWTRAEILAGDHLGWLEAMTENDLIAEGLKLGEGRPNSVSVFAGPDGGFRRRFSVTDDGVTPDRGNEGFFLGFDLISVDITDDETRPPYIRKLNGYVFRRRRGNPINPTFAAGDNGLRVQHAEGFGYSGYLDQNDLSAKIRAIPSAATGASPITYTEAGITGDGMIYAMGTITATKLLFPGLEIPITVRGNDILVDFPIPADSLNFGPVSVTEAALQMGMGENGVFLSGHAAVAVDSIGSGLLTARVEEGNTLLSGEFDFDTDFLDPATADFTYDLSADTLTLGLEAGVPEGTLPGVQSGTINASFSRDSVSVTGGMVMGGMLAGTEVSVSYAPETGLSLGAENIELPVAEVPGVTSATAALFARQDPQTGAWSFGGGGTAVIDLVGVTGSVGVLVDGDKVTITGGPLTVEKGPASGTLMFTATNAPVDDAGNVVEGAAVETWTVWGRGTAEITFGDVLTGSATIVLSPDASVQVEGTIGLPPTFEVFPIQEFERRLFSVETPDFPIWGVSVAGVGIGVFAFADANLDFTAFVGPGQLVDTAVTASMDLDAPQDATVTGSARFLVPAGAGLTLDIGGGLRARIAVGFVEGRVGLDGTLGIEADASAGVTVAWNRTDGLSVAADVEANARPKFRVGVNARVTAGVDLGVTEESHTWGPWQRTLGEFGPDMEMGITVPARWSETDGVDFALADIEVREPQINVREILKSAFEELV